MGGAFFGAPGGTCCFAWGIYIVGRFIAARNGPLFGHDHGGVADDPVADLVALLEHLHHRAALLPVLGGLLHHGVVQIGVKGLALGGDLFHLQGGEGGGRFVQRHHHALLVVLIGAGGVRSHFQCIQNGEDLIHCEAHAVVEGGVLLLGGAAAEVVIFGSRAQQLILCLGRSLFGGIRPGLLSSQLLGGLLAEPLLLGLGVLGNNNRGLYGYFYFIKSY